jgi:hypothetical protein
VLARNEPPPETKVADQIAFYKQVKPRLEPLDKMAKEFQRLSIARLLLVLTW